MVKIADGNFVRTVRVVNLPQIKSLGMIVESQWKGAKDPDAKQSEFVGFLSKQEMIDLAVYLYGQAMDANHEAA